MGAEGGNPSRGGDWIARVHGDLAAPADRSPFSRFNTFGADCAVRAYLSCHPIWQAKKESRRLAERRSGRRASQIVANLGVAALCGSVGWYAGCIAALAEAAADTVSSEIGQAIGGQAWLITTAARSSGRNRWRHQYRRNGRRSCRRRPRRGHRHDPSCAMAGCPADLRCGVRGTALRQRAGCNRREARLAGKRSRQLQLDLICSDD